MYMRKGWEIKGEERAAKNDWHMLGLWTRLNSSCLAMSDNATPNLNDEKQSRLSLLYIINGDVRLWLLLGPIYTSRLLKATTVYLHSILYIEIYGCCYEYTKCVSEWQNFACCLGFHEELQKNQNLDRLWLQQTHIKFVIPSDVGSDVCTLWNIVFFKTKNKTKKRP